MIFTNIISKLDEPTTELDVEGRISLHNKIRKLNQNGTTIILSSHDMAEIETLCTRIGILNDGIIRFIGTTNEPASKVGEKYAVKILTFFYNKNTAINFILTTVFQIIYYSNFLS